MQLTTGQLNELLNGLHLGDGLYLKTYLYLGQGHGAPCLAFDVPTAAIPRALGRITTQAMILGYTPLTMMATFDGAVCDPKGTAQSTIYFPAQQSYDLTTH